MRFCKGGMFCARFTWRQRALHKISLKWIKLEHWWEGGQPAERPVRRKKAYSRKNLTCLKMQKVLKYLTFFAARRSFPLLCSHNYQFWTQHLNGFSFFTPGTRCEYRFGLGFVTQISPN